MSNQKTSDPTAGAEEIDSWITQFETRDQKDARVLLSAIKHIDADQFENKLFALIQSRIRCGSKPVGLYVESERGHRKGRVYRLFKEPNRKHRRAYGSGPKIISPSTTINPEVGSEGLIANVITRIYRLDKNNVAIQPGPDLIRQHKVRRFVLVTDFIGSGERTRKYLDAAWRVRSVRSWWSARRAKGLSFEVIAFSSTENGLKNVKAHPSRPEVYIVEGCPTIRQAFDDPDIRSRMRALCEHYGSRIKDFDPLGYGGAGVLISFAHGMPNNAPAIFHKGSKRKRKGWLPLFPQRVTADRRDALSELAKQRDEIQRELQNHLAKEVLQSKSYLSAPGDLRDAVRVLLALGRSPRSESAVSARTKLSVDRVRNALGRIHRYGWVDKHCRITRKGRRELARLAREQRKEVQFDAAGLYIPRSLRAPRAI